MAESSNSRVVDITDMSDDDPFAELTRIMGHDPRPEAQKAEKPAPETDDAGDMEIDLESELLGDLEGFEEFDLADEPAAASAVSHAAPEPVAEEVPEFGDDFDAAIESALDDEFGDAIAADGFAEQDPEPEAEGGFPLEAEDALSLEEGAFTVEEDLSVEDLSVSPEDLSIEEADIPGFAEEPEPTVPEVEQSAVADAADILPESADMQHDPGMDDLEGALENLLADPALDPRTENHAFEPVPDDAEEVVAESGEEADPPFDYVSAAAERHDYLDDLDPDPVAYDDSAPAPSEQPQPASYEHVSHEEQGVSEDDPFGIIAAMQSARAVPVEAAAAPPPVEDIESDVPDIDTVEIGDTPVAVADDLDIPELNYREDRPVASEFDELETELAGAFGGMTVATAQPAPEPAPDEAPEAGFDDLFGEPEGELAAGDEAAYAAMGAERWSEQQVQTEGAATEPPPFDPAELDDFAPAVGAAASRESGGRRRGLAIAAVVAGVAIIGGVGAYALSSGGSESGMPAVVKADGDPVKVKPENPGGTTVPNQDNEVYQRVTDVSAEPEPTEQEALVTTAEEPVDITAREAAPRMVDFEAPTTTAADDTDAAGAATAKAEGASAPATPEPVKSEERLAPTEQAGTEVSDEVIAVAPRKVRTFVVRPDGTMVQREMPAPEQQPAAEADNALPGVEAPTMAANAAGEAPATEAASAQSAMITDATSEPAEAMAPLGQATAGEETATAETAASQDEPSAVLDEADLTVPATAPIPVARPAQTAPATQEAAATSAVADAGRQEAAPAETEQQVARAEPVDAAAAPVTEAVATEWSVQISSQPSIPAAQQSYRDLAQRYSDLLSGRGVNIVRAEIDGKGTYYRVRIPSQSKDDAVDLCERLQGAGGNCFVSR